MPTTCWPAAGLAAGQVPEREALALLKPMFENPGVLKGRPRFEARHLSARSVRHFAEIDRRRDVDVLRARCGRSGHGLEELSQRHLGHDMLNMADIVGKGRAQAPLETIEVTRACGICAETLTSACTSGGS